MWLWFTLSLSALAAECPQTNLFVDGLDVYSVILPEQTLTFRFSIQDRVAYQHSIDYWRKMLQSCHANKTLKEVDTWEAQQQILEELGMKREATVVLGRWKIRKEISVQERRTALAYAQMLESLEKETGITVLWDLQHVPRARGMVSTARGSERVVDYIRIMYGIE